MSKLSFRARALDASRPMAVYKADEIPDLPDFAAINRAVPQMPTGMEKEEETEHHLQRALSAQQVYGTAEALVIPVPDVEDVTSPQYTKLYKTSADFKPPKQYVHVQVAFGMEQEIPDYDMDSDDETWLTKQAKKMEITPLKFENMMDRLEKGSGQTVVALQEAKALLKEDDDLIIAVYDYWLNKRLKNAGTGVQTRLIPQVKTEKRDGSSTNDPYVAFRRRTEKMQTRKNRKNDESSYEKMLKLRRDLNKALTILEIMKRREKSKKEMLQLTVEIYEKRYQMQDWSGSALSEALAKRHTLPSFVPITDYTNRQWSRGESYVRKKREYKKRKHKNSVSHHNSHQTQQTVQLPQYNEVDVLHNDGYSSEDDALSPVSPSDHEADDDPDGTYAFRRKANCYYQAPIVDSIGNWPWYGREEGGLADRRYRYSLSSITSPRRCIGFARRRVGRGGRMLLDRTFTDWDDSLTELDLTCSSPPGPPSPLNELFTHIKENKYPHFRPRTPTEEEQQQGSGMMGDSLSPTTVSMTPEFNVESFHDHQEQLLAMQRHQQEQLLKQETDLDSSFDLDHSFSSQPTSRFTLDSATARFAASAVCNSTKELIQSSNTNNTNSTTATLSSVVRTCSTNSTTGGVASSAATIAAALSKPVLQSSATNSSTVSVPSLKDGATVTTAAPVTNGPVDSKASGLSTSPQASVLQLNYPLVSAASSTPQPTHSSLSSALLGPSPASSPSLSLTSATAALLSSSVGSAVSALGSTPTLPVIATKAVTQTAPNVLKLGAMPNTRNDSITKENHDGVNNIVKEKVVAMEVT